MTQGIKEYLNFTRKERLGILILVIIILIVAVAPVFFQPVDLYGDTAALAAFREGVIILDRQKLQKKDSFDRRQTYQGQYHQHQDGFSESDNNLAGTESRLPVRVTMFYFDPNTLDPAGWVRLGVREKTAATISRYLARGGRFRSPEDLLKIYGLTEADKTRLLPYVRLPQTAGSEGRQPGRNGLNDGDFERRLQDQAREVESQSQNNRTEYQPRSESAKRAVPGTSGAVYSAPYSRKTLHEIDINLADTIEWKTLPGIGATLAARIVKYRERLGGFYKAEQVAEVFGLPDSVFRKMRTYLKCNPVTGKIRLNEVTPDILEQHPYLKRQLARAIVDYRNQHGPYRQLEDLRQLVLISAELFEKISPYLAL